MLFFLSQTSYLLKPYCFFFSCRYTLLPHGVLQITSVQRTDAGLFRCMASNMANTRYSDEAQLSVTGKSAEEQPGRSDSGQK